MTIRIAVLDYDIGNVRSVAKALERSGAEVTLTADEEVIMNSAGLVVPGVSSFGACVQKLQEKELFDFLRSYISSGKKYLGICLGYQLLFEESEESPGFSGLSVFKGKVRRFQDNVRIPHIGWNEVEFKDSSEMFNGVEKRYFYFVHSYYVDPEDKSIVSGWTEYGVRFASAIEVGNVWACQFHPEKSSTSGLKILENFIRWCSKGV